MIRAYVFGEYYDEVDMSRSHINSVLGCWCWSLTGRPHPTTYTHMLSSQAELEADIALDLTLTRTTLEAELQECTDSAGANPTPNQTKLRGGIVTTACAYRCFPDSSAQRCPFSVQGLLVLVSDSVGPPQDQCAVFQEAADCGQRSTRCCSWAASNSVQF